mmetsp:Transcript_54730/g.159010  ORF Transcript_54730/g.159010 Transcript_54730/m.159010 type:complete len:350 (-) Transcript_54730:54-1103(-)
MPPPAVDYATYDAESSMLTLEKPTAAGIGARAPRRLRAGLLAAAAAAGCFAVTFGAAILALRTPAPADVSGDVTAFKVSSVDGKNLIAVSTYIPRKVFPMMGVAGRSFVNYGVNKEWHGWMTKAHAFIEGLKERAAVDPDGVVIALDTDIINGGCSEATLRDRYERTARASGGAPVIIGADFHQYPDIPGMVQAFETPAMRARKYAVLAEFGMTGHEHDHDETPYPGAIDYAFANAGFVMGPAALLIRVVECMVVFGWQGNNFDDQRGLHICASRHPDIITIDYSGTIVQSTYGARPGFLVGTETGVHNLLLPDKGLQCFVHLNGHKMPLERPWYDWYHHLPKFTISTA